MLLARESLQITFDQFSTTQRLKCKYMCTYALAQQIPRVTMTMPIRSAMPATRASVYSTNTEVY